MATSETAATAAAVPSLGAKERAFWHAVWTLDVLSYIAIALMVYFIGPRVGTGAAGAGIVLSISVLFFGLTRYGLWCLTRPYASKADAIHPAVNRALLCNFDFKLVFFALAIFPSNELVYMSDYMIVYAVLATVVMVGWVALMGPLEAANARDAERNA